VSKGFNELISECIPHEVISPADINKVLISKERKKVSITTLSRTDYLVDEGKKSAFSELYLNKLSMLINCINWTQDSPRLITNDDIQIYAKLPQDQ
jgi:hypothetical protein